MVSRTEHEQQKEENKLNSQGIKLGGFPPIIYLSETNKKIKEFSKIYEKEDNIKNINKLNILDIKNILGQN